MFPTVDPEDILQVTSLNKKHNVQSRDAPKPHENLQVAKQNNSNRETLNMLIKEFVFCLALALTTYGALHNTSSKTSKFPQAERFFNSASIVTDWYRGQLSNALTAINKADVSFVMYYAPWDAESQYVRGEFEKAALVLNNRVHFSSINCWNPGSECRLMHNKISSWPILIAYTVTSRGVLYKGLKDAHSMVKFLELIIKPLDKVSSAEDLVNLLSVCEAVAVGYTPMSDTSKYYNIWYNVALKTKEFDTIGEICFGVVTSEELAVSLGVDSLPSARLMLWNDTKEYLLDGTKAHTWSEQALTEWILENFTQPVARIIPLWRKAFNFERYVDGNPLLILFTPLNPLYEQLPSYDLLREVAMEYYNCNNNVSSQWISELIKLQQMQRLLYQKKDFMKFCQDYKKPSKKTNLYRKAIVSRNNKYVWNNATYKNQKYGEQSFLRKRGLDITRSIESADDNLHFVSTLEMIKECSAKVLPAEKSFYENYDAYCQSHDGNSYCEHDRKESKQDIETTMLPFEGDPLSPESLIELNIQHFCKLMKFAKEWGPPVYPAKVHDVNVTNIHGLACTNNFSLNMIAVDSVVNHHFAESLGIDIRNMKDMTTLVILDSRHENQYVLTEEYSANSVREFIYNFTHVRLERWLRTRVAAAAHTHFFGSAGVNEQMDIDNATLHIADLTTHTFRGYVNTPGVTTLVGVCDGGCGARLSLALATAARLLAAGGLNARAARLDARAHDLPWHYTADRLPAVLVFPADRGEAASRSYPGGARVSGSGLAALALRSLGAPHHVRVRLALCAHVKFKNEKQTCLKDIKEHITSVIGRNLKYWRRTGLVALRQALSLRLQHLHKVSLELSLIHIDDLSKHNVKQKALVKSLCTLANHWDIDVSTLRRNDTTSRKSRS